MFILVDIRFRPLQIVGLPCSDVRIIQSKKKELIKSGIRKDMLQVRTVEGFKNVPILQKKN